MEEIKGAHDVGNTDEGTRCENGDAKGIAADYALLDEEARAVLDFWFGEPGTPAFGQPSKRWFQRDDAFDALILERFGATLERARRGECDGWARTPLGALALIVVLDQFSRNTCRGRADAFAADEQALAVARRLVDTGRHLDLPSPEHRAFAYLPFEHAESRTAQRESVRLFEALARETGSRDKGSYFDYACLHAAVIERFGRFPHRNAALGRESTPDECAFLREPRSAF